MFYLDAISKNVFEHHAVYTRQFATLVIRLFLETYETVNQSTQGKMLLTLQTGAPAVRCCISGRNRAGVWVAI